MKMKMHLLYLDSEEGIRRSAMAENAPKAMRYHLHIGRSADIV